MSEDTGTTPEPAAAPTVDDLLAQHGADESVVTAVKDGLGVTNVEELGLLNEQDLVGVGMKVVQVRKLLASLTPAAAPTAAVDSAALGAVAIENVLPAVPDDASWLEALKTGGMLKVEPSTVISAVRAALADKVHLFEVPDMLVREMEKHAESLDEQVDQTYFKLRKQLATRSYAEVFSAIEGLDSKYVTDGRRRELFLRIDQYLWPAVLGFQDQLKQWSELWQQQSMNPLVLFSAFNPALTGGAGMAMPPVQPPDTTVLRDQAEAVNDAINKVFAGTGAYIAAALAYDASQIKKTLEDRHLPAMIGADNRDQMLKQLNVAVSSNYPRLETNLSRYVLGILQIKDQPAGNEELQYFSALFSLGTSINWSELGGRSQVTGIGGDRL